MKDDHKDLINTWEDRKKEWNDAKAGELPTETGWYLVKRWTNGMDVEQALFYSIVTKGFYDSPDDMKNPDKKYDYGKSFVWKKITYLEDYTPEIPEPIWIVNDMGELGVQLGDRCFFLYKGENIEYDESLCEPGEPEGTHDDDTPILYRVVGKREFGETCQPRRYFDDGYSKSDSGLYTAEVSPWPGEPLPEQYKWKPLPNYKPKVRGYKNKILVDFFQNLVDNQKDLPPELDKLIDKHFWELF